MAGGADWTEALQIEGAGRACTTQTQWLSEAGQCLVPEGTSRH